MTEVFAAAPIPCAWGAACAVALGLGLLERCTNVGEYFARFFGLPNELENPR